MTLEEILKALEFNRGKFPEDAVRLAIERREEITPHLLRILETDIGRAADILNMDNYFGHLFAIYLLAYFRETRAFLLVIDLARLPGTLPHDITGDFITEDLDRVLASVYGGDSGPIKGLIEDADVDEFVRGKAIESLALMVLVDILPRREVMEYYIGLFRGGLEREPSQAWNELACSVADIHPAEAYADLKAAYDEGLVDPGHISFREIEEAMAQSLDWVLMESRRISGGLVSDPVKEMSGWHCFSPALRNRRVEKSIPKLTLPKKRVTTKSKTGRD